MVNYNNSKIYKIQKIGGNSDIYIGSTTKKYLSSRLADYKISYKNNKTNNKCFQVFELYGVNNCEIVLIETFPCNTKDELLKREKCYIGLLKCVNKIA